MLKTTSVEKDCLPILELLATPGAARTLSAIRIYRTIRERDIAARAGVPYNVVRDVLIRSIDLDLVEKERLGNVILFSLTRLGEECLSGYDAVRSSVFRSKQVADDNSSIGTNVADRGESGFEEPNPSDDRVE